MSIGEGVWWPHIIFMLTTIAAYKPSWKFLGLEVGNAELFIREVLLKVGKIFRYKTIVAG
jgi:hypothetical protein